MVPIVESIEIARAPQDVFDYVTDTARLPEWQESVVRAPSPGGPGGVGSKSETTRSIGRWERTMAMETTEHDPPRSWGVRGIDGPVRGIVSGTVEPIDQGARSRVTIELSFEGRGLGKLLVPLVVRRQAARELPMNLQNLKDRLEDRASS